MTSALARRVIALALLLGVAGDLSLRGEPPRLGALLWIVLLVASVVAADRALVSAVSGADGDVAAREPSRRRERIVLLTALLLASAGLVLRDAQMLHDLDIAVILVSGALLVWSAVERGLARFELWDAPYVVFRALRAAVTGAPPVFKATVEEGEDAGVGARAGRRRELVVGTVLAVPPLVIVAALLGSADPVLGAWLDQWRALISDDAIEHVLRFGVISWGAVGWLTAVTVPAAPAPAAGRAARDGAAFARVAPTLYGLAVLFAIFLGLQARVLFGGAGYLAETSGLSIAEYARGGFFDLVAVTGVVLGVLLIAERMIGDARAEDAGRFRTAGWLLLVLMIAPIVSAFARMALYVSYFGLSTDRLYAFAGMLLITVAFAWFGWTVLRSERTRFAPGLLIAVGVWAILLNVLNPEALVVRVNVARAVAGASFDAPYHLRLSADARGPLREALAVLPFGECLQVRHALDIERRDAQLAVKAWQGWNLPQRAARAMPVVLPECVPTR